MNLNQTRAPTHVPSLHSCTHARKKKVEEIERADLAAWGAAAAGAAVAAAAAARYRRGFNSFLGGANGLNSRKIFVQRVRVQQHDGEGTTVLGHLPIIIELILGRICEK